MSSSQQLSLTRRRAGRPSKGKRQALFVRVPPGLARRFADAAACAGVSQSDHMADILANRYYWKCLDEEQGHHLMSPVENKSDRVDLNVRIPQDLRERFVAEVNLAGLSQSDFMTGILTEEYLTTGRLRPQRDERQVVSRKSA